MMVIHMPSPLSHGLITMDWLFLWLFSAFFSFHVRFTVRFFRCVKKLIKLLLSERGCIQFDFRNAVAKKILFYQACLKLFQDLVNFRLKVLVGV